MSWLDDIGGAFSRTVGGIWDATLGRVFNPPPPPAPPEARMVLDRVEITAAKDWEQTVPLISSVDALASFPTAAALPGVSGPLKFDLPDARVAAARQKATSAVFYGTPGATEDKRTPTGFTRVEQDAWDVTTGFADAAAVQAANDLIEVENGPLEAEKLRSLTEVQRQQYGQLADAIKGMPRARLALQMLLFEGTLTHPKASREGKDLLTSLAELQAQPLAAGVDRNALLGNLIHEIAVPSVINQRNRGSCTVTSMQILMAMKRPEEYVRVVAGLASPDGQVVLMNGQTLARKAGTEAPDGTGRSESTRLWAPAFLEFGYTAATYDNATDENASWFRTDKAGFSAGGHGAAFRAMTGGSGRTVVASDSTNLLVQLGDMVVMGGQGVDTLDRKDLVGQVYSQVNAGDPVPVALAWGTPDAAGKIHGGHMVLVTGTDADRVYYRNPWGSEESMSRTEFEKRLWSASFADLDAAATYQPSAAQIKAQGIQLLPPAGRGPLAPPRLEPPVIRDFPPGADFPGGL